MWKQLNLPTELKEILESQFDLETLEKIAKGYLAKRKPSLRINTLKTTKKEIEEILNQNHILYKEVPWYENALIILNKTSKELTELAIFKEGKIYLQSLSSMIPVLLLNPQEHEQILDMTAAPGSKTTQIAMQTNNKAQITTCEKNQIRLERLKYNIEKQGVTCTTILKTDATLLDDNFSFDKILLDAPCSGSGTISTWKNQTNMWEEKQKSHFIEVQKKLLRKAIRLLKPNHTMIYSTCSILSYENEEIIKSIQKEYPITLLPIQLDASIPTLKNQLNNTITICPDEQFEGFFIACLKKEP